MEPETQHSTAQTIANTTFGFFSLIVACAASFIFFVAVLSDTIWFNYLFSFSLIGWVLGLVFGVLGILQGGRGPSIFGVFISVGCLIYIVSLLF